MTPQKSEADYRLARFADTTQEDLFFCFFVFPVTRVFDTLVYVGVSQEDRCDEP